MLHNKFLELFKLLETICTNLDPVSEQEILKFFYYYYKPKIEVEKTEKIEKIEKIEKLKKLKVVKQTVQFNPLFFLLR